MASPGGLFILHTRKPRLLIEVLVFDVADESAIMAAKNKIPIGSSLNYKEEYYLFYLLEAYDEINILADQEQQIADNLAKLMRRAADWYQSYLKFVHKNDKEKD